MLHDRKSRNRSKRYLGVSGANDSSAPGVCFVLWQIAWYHLSLYRPVLEWHKPKINLHDQWTQKLVLASLHVVVYITFLLIKTRARPGWDGGLAEAYTPERAMKMENLCVWERESQIQVSIFYHQRVFPTVANTHWVFSTVANTHHWVFATINEYLQPVANTHCEYLLP